jgi:ribosomal protein S18 acetylase RimI-like enzyme
MKIRNANGSDFKLISALAITTFYEAYYRQDPSIDLASYVTDSFSLKNMSKDLKDKNSTFFIAEIDGKAVGYAKLRENSKADCITDQKSIELQRIYILDNVKRQYVGKALMEKCFETARGKGFETLWLGVWWRNETAQKFYEKLGFERVGELEFEYGAGVEMNYVLKIDL